MKTNRLDVYNYQHFAFKNHISMYVDYFFLRFPSKLQTSDPMTPIGQHTQQLLAQLTICSQFYLYSIQSLIYTCICVCVCVCHSMYMELRGQLVRIIQF